MCFSATVSFVAAGMTGVIGLVALSQVPSARHIPFAAFGTLLLASRPSIRWFGYASGFGLVLALLVQRTALISIWCFFAAIAAILVVIAIEQERRDLNNEPVK